MSENSLERAKILVIDDQPAMTGMIEKLLTHAGYRHIEQCNDPRAAARAFAAFQPDLVILDLHMPGLGGFQVLELLALGMPDRSYLPVLVLTGDESPEARERALRLGAKDFLTKPFDRTEALLRIRNLLDTRFLSLELRTERDLLEERVAERTADLEKRSHEIERAHVETLERLARAAEFRDDDTGEHTYRVGELAGRLAFALGLSEQHAALIRRAAPLHDIGKIGVPDDILLKPGALSAAEREVMEAHTTMGAQILSGSESDLIHLAERIVLTHHERWDGGGYPWGLKGAAIPIEGRIVAVVDFFDALVNERPYRDALPPDRVLGMLEAEIGTRFDPDVAGAFLQMMRADPAALATAGTDRPRRQPGTAAEDAGHDGHTILLVDDRDTMRSFIRRVLEREGHRVFEADSAAAALQLASRTDFSLDLLLTDVVMPDLDGRVLAARITDARPATRVLFMSGYAEGELPPLTETVTGALGNFLQKPFTPDQLARTVRDVVHPLPHA